MAEAAPTTPLSLSRIFRTWWPLAASWLLMSLELPAVSAVIARLANPEINLAAYGGVVFPLALIIESPIIMLLAASTALSKDWASYLKLRRFMLRAGAILTVLHLIIAVTPLYYVVVSGIIGAPAEIVEPSRIGLILMLPWSWSIAFRRFNQGILIRFDHSRAVGVGTAIRLGSNWLVLLVGYLIGTFPGIVVGTAAVATGVMSEALYAGLVTRHVIRDEVLTAPQVQPALTFPAFIDFYIPLALTSLLNLLVQPIGSAALSRMPLALASLAAWPVVSGLSFIFRSPGIAFNEVVVALMDRPGSVAKLRRFTLYLGGVATALLLLVVATPLAAFWLRDLSALAPDLATMARPGLWLMLPLPMLVAMQSWYQGTIMAGRKTRGITESLAVFLVVAAIVLWAGVALGTVTGLHVGLAAFTLASAAQTLWLWIRSRRPMQAAEARDNLDTRSQLVAAETPVK
jgi:hypothetical protein